MMPRTRRWLAVTDQRLFEAVAAADPPIAAQVLPWLSRAANKALLWAGVAGAFAASRRPPLRRAAARGLVAVALSSPAVNLAGKQAFRRARPPVTAVPVARVHKIPSSASFPSGHSASAAAFTTAVAIEAGAAAPPVAVLAAAVAFSRVYTGAHYPGDVLAGIACGVAAGFAAGPILRFQRSTSEVVIGVRSRPGEKHRMWRRMSPTSGMMWGTFSRSGG